MRFSLYLLVCAFHCTSGTTVLTLALADEVESLTAARAGAMAGTEPSDGLRVRIYSLPFTFALLKQVHTS